MGILQYERPREKLRSRGAVALTLIELLQIVIGPGSSRMTGARLARAVAKVVATGDITFEALIALPGVGEAKACQILASVELGDRVRAG